MHTQKRYQKIIAYWMIALLIINLFSGALKSEVAAESGAAVTINGVTDGGVYSLDSDYTVTGEKVISYEFTGITDTGVKYYFSITSRGSSLEATSVEVPVITEQELADDTDDSDSVTVAIDPGDSKKGTITIAKPETNTIYTLTLQAKKETTGTTTVLAEKTVHFRLGTAFPAYKVTVDKTLSNDKVTVTVTADKDSVYNYVLCESAVSSEPATAEAIGGTVENDVFLIQWTKDYEGTAGAETDYSYTYYLTDSSSNRMSGDSGESRNFTVDKKDPVITVNTDPTDLTNPQETVIYKLLVDEDSTVEIHTNKTPLEGGAAVGSTDDLGSVTAGTGKTKTYTEDGTYEVWTTATDAAGNTTESAHTNFQIKDVTSPVIGITGVTDNKIYNSGQTLQFEVKDRNPKPDNYSITVKRNDADVTGSFSCTWTQDAGDSETYKTSISFPLSSNADEGKYTVTLNAKDANGNPENGASQTITFWLDKNPPVIESIKVLKAASETEVSQNGDGKYYLNEAGKIQVKVSENYVSADKKLTTTISTTGNAPEQKESVTSPATLTTDNTYSAEGNYTVTVKAKDAAGNESSESTKKFVIDKTKPVLSIAGIAENGMSKVPVTLTYTSKDRNHDFAAYKISGRRMDSNGVTTWTEQNTADWEKDGYTADGQTDYTTQKQVRYTEEGKYEITFEGVDKAGNTAERKTITFYIDKTAPEISNITYSNEGGFISEKYSIIFSNKTVKVEFDAVDQLVGVVDNQVYVTLGTATDRTEASSVYIARKSLSGKYYVYVPTDMALTEYDGVLTVWASDKLGNQSYLTSTRIIYNVDKPKITMTCDVDYTKWTNQDVTFHTTVSDEKSGLDKVIYYINGEAVKTVTFTEFVTSYSYDLTATATAATAEGYPVKVEVTNNNGTTDTMTRKVFIDKEKPQVELSGVTNGTHYNSGQSIATKVKDVSYTNTNTVYVATRKLDGQTYNEDIAGFTLQTYEETYYRDVEKEGSYEIYAVTTDSAGNKTSSNTLNFVIDKTAPVLRISGTEEGSFNKDSVTLTFHCIESFYETNTVNIRVNRTLDGNTTTKYITDFPKDRKQASLSRTFSDEGTYEITFTATDKAGNVADSKTISFTVDKTKPVFNIQRVEGSTANEIEGDVSYQAAQTIKFTAVDRNHSIGDYSVRIERTTDDGTDIQVMGTGNITWGALDGDTIGFLHEFTEEGQYRITLSGKDKAGNESSKTVTFRIDRTPPVIEQISRIQNGTCFGESVEMIYDVTEFNYKDTNVNITVERTLDGTTTMDAFQSVIMNGKVQRYQYSCEKEGYYKIHVTSTDAAGNSAEELVVYFVIDKTKPVLSIAGINEGEMTREPVTLTYDSQDRNHDFAAYRVTGRRTTLSGGEVTWTEEATWKQDGYNVNLQNVYTTQKQVVYTEEGNYEIIFEGIDRAGNVAARQTRIFSIDHTAPAIYGVTYSNEGGIITEKYATIFSNETVKVEFTVEDQVVGAEDSCIYVTLGEKTDRTEDTPVYIAHKSVDGRYYVYVPKDMALTEYDGVITIWANDRLNNQSSLTSTRIIYNVDKPVIRMECDVDYTAWTNQNVTFHTTVSDNKSGLKKVVYRIDGKVVKTVTFTDYVKSYDYDLTAEKTADKVTGYPVTVEVTNNNGTTDSMKRQVYIDKVKPQVKLSGVTNGTHYAKSQTISTTVNDVSYTNTKTVYFVSRTLDDVTYTEKMSGFTSKKYEESCKRKVTKEGSYKIYAVTTDSAGNKTTSNTLRFVVDKTAPKLAISGTQEGSMNSGPVTLKFECTESFYQTNHVNINVERTLDGRTTTTQITGFPKNKKKASCSHTFSEDGTYKITFSAVDKAGNVAAQKTISFSVDQTKPGIQITGTHNYEKWDKPATVRFSVEESYYSGNRVTITGTRTDIDGNVTDIELPAMSNSGKISSLIHTFSQDGIYAFQITAKDEAGNEESDEIHFIIDKTAPQINKVNRYQGGYYQDFCMTDTLEDVFKDLTLVSYRILLNGVEYDGISPVEAEGKYSLSVEITDELNHTNTENIEFIIDHTAPKVIFTGVKDGEAVSDSGTVMLSLTNPEDEITGVRMNGVEYAADTRQLEYTEYGNYQIEVDCVDKAGNSVTRRIQFVYHNPLTTTLLFVTMGGLMLVTGIWLFVRTRRKEEEEKKI